MKKRVLFLLLIILLSGCLTETYSPDHIPVSVHDGVFSFKLNGRTYSQYIQKDHCSAYAMCHSSLDTMIISGGVGFTGNNPNNRILRRVIFIIPLLEVDGEKEICLKKEDVIIEVNCEDTLENGQLVTWREYLNAEKATLCFENYVDSTFEDQYISGSFSVDGPTWKGNRLTLTDGYFKFWVKKVDHRFGDSSSSFGYNVMFFSQ